MLVKWDNFYLYSSQFSLIICGVFVQNCKPYFAILLLLSFNLKHPFQFFQYLQVLLLGAYTLYSFAVLIQLCLCFLLEHFCLLICLPGFVAFASELILIFISDSLKFSTKINSVLF